MMDIIVKSDHFCENAKPIVLLGGWLPVYECKLGLNHFECYKCKKFEGNDYYKRTIERIKKIK